MTAHWGMPDPAAVDGSDEAKAKAFRDTGITLKRRLELMMAAGGAAALEWESERSQEGALARSWLRSKGNSIEGGTSEVQLNVIAKRLLNLPGA